MRRHRSRHVDHRAFARRVEQVRCSAPDARHAGHVDNAASVAPLVVVLEHGWYSVFRHHHHAADVDLHGFRPRGHVHVQSCTARASNTHTVEQNIQAAERPESSFDDAFTVRFTGDVRSDGDGRSFTLGLDHGDCSLRESQVEVHTDDIAAFIGEQYCTGAAIAYAVALGARACYDGDLVAERSRWLGEVVVDHLVVFCV